MTRGHLDLIDRAKPLFDHLIIGIGVNSAKQPMFSVERRLKWCRDIYRGTPGISAETYEGLTVNFCRLVGARYILRGLRYLSDLEYEKSIAAMNRHLDPAVETIFLTTSPEFSMLTSTLVREVMHHGGDVSSFLPQQITSDIRGEKDF